MHLFLLRSFGDDACAASISHDETLAFLADVCGCAGKVLEGTLNVVGNDIGHAAGASLFLQSVTSQCPVELQCWFSETCQLLPRMQTRLPAVGSCCHLATL